jgi:hypothetical protein
MNSVRMKCAQSIGLRHAVAERYSANRNWYVWESHGSKIRITRGYRELRSPAEMRKLLNRKIRQQAGICVICHEELRITTI